MPRTKILRQDTDVTVPSTNPASYPDNGTGKDPATLKPALEVHVHSEADPLQEYINSAGWGMANRVRALPPWIDELERDFGLDIYDRMADESIVSSSVGILMSSAMVREGNVVPARESGEARADDAMMLANFCADNIERMQDTPWDPYLYEMADGAFTHGHKCSEIVYETGESRYTQGTKYLWQRLKPKKQTNTAMVVDPFGNVLGYLYGRPTTAIWALPGPGSVGTAANLLPKDKVARCVYLARNSDPRGSSGLRPSYHPWWMLQEAYDDLKKYIRMFGVPPGVSTLPPNANDQIRDPLTGQELQRSAARVQNDALKAVRAGGIVTLGYGSTFEFKEPRSDGRAILQSIEQQEKRIVRAITFQELATTGNPNATRGTSSIHQDMFGIRVSFIKDRICAFVKNELFAPLVRMNFDKSYWELIPDYSLGTIEQVDFAVVSIAISRMYAAIGPLMDPLLPEIFEMLGFQVPEEMKTVVQKSIQAGASTDAVNAHLGITPVAAGMQGGGMKPSGTPTNSRVGKRSRGSSVNYKGSEPGVGNSENGSPMRGMPGNSK